MNNLKFVLCLFLVLLTGNALSQDMRTETVHFAAGTTGTSIDGQIKGYDSVLYIVGAAAGQTMSVRMDTSNGANYFNIFEPGKQPGDAAMFIGSTSGNDYSGRLAASGDYSILVYMMRSAARRDEIAHFTLEITIDGNAAQAPSRDPDYADGLSGGPDFWEVTNVPANDTLNVRAGPGTDAEVIGELQNGDPARNLGCRMVDSARWCQIEAGFDQIFTGWVNGRYLREGIAPGAANAQSSGTVPCSTTSGQPTRQCPFRASRDPNGNATMWIDIGSGAARYVEFREGNPIHTDPGLDITYERLGDLYLLRIGGVERYEIPDAVIYGG
ncbi:SH3 domain-containing protein [Hoeflea sp. CAU 1731]